MTVRSSPRQTMWCHRWSLYSKTLENMTSAIFTLQYSFVFTFTNIFLTMRQDWYCLFKHCLSTQWRPHVRPRAMPRAVFSFTNNNPFYHKQPILSGNNTSSVEIIQSSSFEDGPIVIRPEVPTLHYSVAPMNVKFCRILETPLKVLEMLKLFT